MRKIFTLILFLSFVTSCKQGELEGIPAGFEHISRDGPSHFVYVHEKYLGNKTRQKDVGKAICDDVYKQKQYCEVYYFANKEDVPVQFPIIDRIYPIGLYEVKDGIHKFKVLASPDDMGVDKDGKVVFYKSFYKRFYGGSQPVNPLRNRAIQNGSIDQDNSDY